MGRAALAAIVAAAVAAAGSSEASGPASAAGAPAAASGGGRAGRLGSPGRGEAARERVLFLPADGGAAAAASPGAPQGAPHRENVKASGGLTILSETVSAELQALPAAAAESSLQRMGGIHDEPWWIEYGVKEEGPLKDHGTFKTRTFSSEQQAQFGVDEDGTVVDQAKFDDAIAALATVESKTEGTKGEPKTEGTKSETAKNEAQFGIDEDGTVVDQAEFGAAAAAPAPARLAQQQGVAGAFPQQAGAASYQAASTGCQTCCSSGQCMQAYMNSQPGMCCGAGSAPMCCPQGATCTNGQCSMGSQQQYGGGGYGAPGGYGSGYGAPGGGYGHPPINPISGLLRWVSQHMMLIWIVLAILGCMGIGGPTVHYLQMALCGMSLFNCLCPGAANDLYGQGGGMGGGGYSYGPPGGF